MTLDSLDKSYFVIMLRVVVGEMPKDGEYFRAYVSAKCSL
jgi:hypothetical protein